MSNDYYLHSTSTGMTVEFSPRAENTVYVSYQRTLDPNEEIDGEFRTTQEARAEWKELVAEGYRPAKDWHSCKRCRYEECYE